MGNMEERWRRRQSENRGRGEATAQPSAPASQVWGNSQFTEEEKLEAWRQLQATHMQRQSRAIESIRSYVATWFWLTIVGALLYVIAAASAGNQF